MLVPVQTACICKTINSLCIISPCLAASIIQKLDLRVFAWSWRCWALISNTPHLTHGFSPCPWMATIVSHNEQFERLYAGVIYSTTGTTPFARISIQWGRVSGIDFVGDEDVFVYQDGLGLPRCCCHRSNSGLFGRWLKDSLLSLFQLCVDWESIVFVRVSDADTHASPLCSLRLLPPLLYDR